MIRLAAPLVLLALPALAALLVFARGRRRELLLPALAAAFLIVALARPMGREEGGRRNVYVLLDRSPSVAASVSDDEVNDRLDALRAANPDWRFGIVAFASRASVSSPLADVADASSSFSGEDLGERTDLAPAMKLALAGLPEGDLNQIVLASDGRLAEGLLEAVSAARSAGVPVFPLPLGRLVSADATLARLEVSSHAEAGRPLQIVATIESESPGSGILALYRDGDLVSSNAISLAQKVTQFQIRDVIPSPGAHTYRAVVKCSGDPIAENDAMSTFVQTETRPPLLIVSPAPPEGLLDLLAASETAYVVSTSVPPLAQLAGYRNVLIAGLPLYRLQPDAIETLRAFVSELGGGLLVAAGEADLRGVGGGWIEDLVPVTFTLPQRATRASLAIVYLLDRSASMLGDAEGAAKMEVVREAAAASVELLEPDAVVGVIAFDRSFQWIRPPTPIPDNREIYAELRSLEPSGGTDIYYPTVAALDALEQVSARVKHIVILSDGKTVDEVRDWDSLFARLEAQSAIQVSVIAVGPLPNRDLLDRLAKAGHGSTYLASDVSSLPRVTMETTQRLSRSRFVNREARVDGPLAGADLAAIPPLQGYALVYPRPTSEVLLSAGSDPVFARWRLGLGRVGFLTADLAGIWSRDWLSWSRAPLLLETLLGSVEAESFVTEGLQPSVEVRSSGVHVSVEARDSDGAFADFLELETVLLPGGTSAPLGQTGVGFYEATFPILAEGGYALRVDDRTRDRSALLPFSVPYPEEYRQTGVDEATLRAIARATGGRLLEGETLPETSAATAGLSYIPVQQPALLISLGLFLLELVRRKLPRRTTPLARSERVSQFHSGAQVRFRRR